MSETTEAGRGSAAPTGIEPGRDTTPPLTTKHVPLRGGGFRRPHAGVEEAWDAGAAPLPLTVVRRGSIPFATPA